MFVRWRWINQWMGRRFVNQLWVYQHMGRHFASRHWVNQDKGQRVITWRWVNHGKGRRFDSQWQVNEGKGRRFVTQRRVNHGKGRRFVTQRRVKEGKGWRCVQYDKEQPISYLKFGHDGEYISANIGIVMIILITFLYFTVFNIHRDYEYVTFMELLNNWFSPWKYDLFSSLHTI